MVEAKEESDNLPVQFMDLPMFPGETSGFV